MKQSLRQNARKIWTRHFSNPQWRTIGVLGQAKILGVSATVIVVVPLWSRFIVPVHDHIQAIAKDLSEIHPSLAHLASTAVQFLTLPLSLKILVFAAMFALSGKLVYVFRCPAYLKSGDSFWTYRMGHAHALEILDEDFRKFWNKAGLMQTLELNQMVDRMHASFREHGNWKPGDPIANDTSLAIAYHSGTGTRTLVGTLLHLLQTPEIGEPIYTVMRDLNDGSHYNWRLCCAWCYHFALLCTGITLVMQVWWIGQALFI